MLGLSQSRLSELERGNGSFAAEHLLVLAGLFNIEPSEFAPPRAGDEHSELQNALARFGATHLRERDDILPDARLDLARALKDALVLGDSRFVTGLAPVLVQGIDKINLTRLHATLAESGFEYRLAWLLDNTLSALRAELAASPPPQWGRRYRRAIVVLQTALDEVVARHRRQPTTDLLDPLVRSTKSRRRIEADASPISRRWGIVSSLRPADFARALRDARVAS